MNDDDESTAMILDAIGKVGEQVTGIRAGIESLDAKVTRMLAALGRLEGFPDGRNDAGLLRHLIDVAVDPRVH